MDNGGTSHQQSPTQPPTRRPAATPQTPGLARRLAATGTQAAARRGARLWRSPLAAPARRPTHALTTTLNSQATRLQPAVTRAMQRGAEKVLASPLPETVTAALVETGALERIAAVLLKGQTLERLLDIAERERAVQRVLDHSLAEHLTTEVSAGEHIAHAIAAILPGKHGDDGAGAPDAGPDQPAPLAPPSSDGHA